LTFRRNAAHRPWNEGGDFTHSVGVHIYPTRLNLVGTSGGDLEEGRGYRVGGGAGLVVGFDYQGPLAVGSGNEICYA
jgi:hypothetical protein